MCSMPWEIPPGAPSSSSSAQRPSAVVDLADRLPVSRPAVSQHLKVLKQAGLVRDVQVGTRRVYSLDPDGLAGLRDYLERFWRTALHSFKTRVEQEKLDKEEGESNG